MGRCPALGAHRLSRKASIGAGRTQVGQPRVRESQPPPDGRDRAGEEHERTSGDRGAHHRQESPERRRSESRWTASRTDSTISPQRLNRSWVAALQERAQLKAEPYAPPLAPSSVWSDRKSAPADLAALQVDATSHDPVGPGVIADEPLDLHVTVRTPRTNTPEEDVPASLSARSASPLRPWTSRSRSRRSGTFPHPRRRAPNGSPSCRCRASTSHAVRERWLGHG